MQDPFLKKLGNRIRKERMNCGLNQDEMSQRCGIDRSFLSGIERGHRNITILTLVKIASGLELPLHELLRDV